MERFGDRPCSARTRRTETISDCSSSIPSGGSNCGVLGHVAAATKHEHLAVVAQECAQFVLGLHLHDPTRTRGYLQGIRDLDGVAQCCSSAMPTRRKVKLIRSPTSRLTFGKA